MAREFPAESGRERIDASHLVDALGYELFLPGADEIVEGEKANAKVSNTRAAALSREWCCTAGRKKTEIARNAPSMLFSSCSFVTRLRSLYLLSARMIVQFAPRKAGKRKLEQSGKSMTELNAQQVALFERSRAHARLHQQISSGALQPQTLAQTFELAAASAACAAPSPAAL